MNRLSFDKISGRDLFENADLHLSTNIAAAETEARQVVHSGETIREVHDHGNINDSKESTNDGAQRVADDLAERVQLGERKNRFFGQHIKEAVAALRPLWRNK